MPEHEHRQTTVAGTPVGSQEAISLNGRGSHELTLRSLVRGRIEPLTQHDLRARAQAAPRVLVDLGTGDGSYPYREARENPDTLCIGIDPVAENMRKVSNRIGRKPSRGGVADLVLLVASAEDLPLGLQGVANRVTVFFPWSALLRALVAPDLEIITSVGSLLAREGRIEALINLKVFEDEAYRTRKDLPMFEPASARDALAESYRGVDLEIDEWEVLDPRAVPVRTTWGQHLTLGSGRPTLRFVARRTGAPPPGAAP